jgi:hypothetical protein
MRSKFKTTVMMFVAVLAISIVGVSSASAALPEFDKPFPNKIEVKSSPGTLLVAKNVSIACTANTAKGEITGAKTITATFTFTGCGKYSSAGAKEGEIKTAELEGKPVAINGGKEVGVDFQRKGTGNFAEFSKGTGAEKETLKVRGALIGAVSPANIKTNVWKLVFKEKGGVQEPAEYENATKEKVKAVLETEGSGEKAFAFEQMGVEAGFEEGSSAYPDEITAAQTTRVIAQIGSPGLPEFRNREEPVLSGSFEGINLGAPVFEAGGAVRWDYGSASVKGEFIGPKEVALVITFSDGTEGRCYNSGETLVTTTLIGRLGYVSKASKEVGLLLEPLAGQPFAAKCRSNIDGGVSEEWWGSLIGRMTPVNSFTKSLTLSVRGKSSGEQELEKFEGEEVLHHLEGREEGHTGGKLNTSSTFELTKFSREVEIDG